MPTPSRSAAKSGPQATPASPTRSPAPTPDSASTHASAALTRLTQGRPLPPSTRERMETSFGRSFADVRVHTDANASELTRQHAAEAFTIGRDIAFSPGAYRPGTHAGDHRIAHELTHVAQQGGTAVSGQARAVHSHSSEPAELQAESAASSVMRGQRVSIHAGVPSTRNRIMRRAKMGARPTIARSPARTPVPSTGEHGAAARKRADQQSTLRGPATAVTDASVSPAASPRPSTASPQAGATAPEPERASPDQAQTPQAAISPPAPVNVMIAGASAGAKQPEKPGAAGKQKHKKSKTKAGKKGAAKTKGKGKGQGKGKVAGKGKGKLAAAPEFGCVDRNVGNDKAKAALDRLDQRADAQQQHESPEQRIDQARAAVQPPANEGESRSQGAQVATVAQSEPPTPDPAAVRNDMKQATAAASPNTLEEVVEIRSSGRFEGVRSLLSRKISSQAAGVRGTIEKVSRPPPPQPVPEPTPQPEPEAAPQTATPELAKATPPSAPDSCVDGTVYSDAANAQLEARGVSPEELANVKESPFVELRDQKAQLDAQAEAAQGEYRQTEGPALKSARGQLEAAEQVADDEMASTRETEQAQVLGEQDRTRTDEEGQRGSAADQITTIYETAEKAVSEKLDGLTETAVERFNTQQQGYLQDLETDTEADIERYKDERYSGIDGAALWGVDLFRDFNELPGVRRIYERNRATYENRVDQLIGDISADTTQTIKDCKQQLADARAKIDELVAKLDPEARAAAEKAITKANEAFARLEKNIQATEERVTKALSEARDKAMKQADDAIAEIREKNKSTLDKMLDAVEAIADALGEFLQLGKDIAAYGIAAFIADAATQALDGLKMHLWDALQEVFRDWLVGRFAIIQTLLNLPGDWLQTLEDALADPIGMLIEVWPSVLPELSVVAGLYIAARIAAKLIPGVGALVALIDAIQAAMSLLDSLLGAGRNLVEFFHAVAEGRSGGEAFATAVAFALVGALEAVLQLVGIDDLIRRAVKVIAKPFGKLFKSISKRVKKGKGKDKATDEGKDTGKPKDKDKDKDKDEDEDGGLGTGTPKAKAKPKAKSKPPSKPKTTGKGKGKGTGTGKGKGTGTGKGTGKGKGKDKGKGKGKGKGTGKPAKLGRRMTVSTGEEKHTVWIQVIGKSATVMASSTAANISRLLASFTKRASERVDRQAHKLINRAERTARTIDRIADDAANDIGSKSFNQAIYDNKRKTIVDRQEDLMTVLLQIMKKLGVGELEPKDRVRMFRERSGFRPMRQAEAQFAPAPPSNAGTSDNAKQEGYKTSSDREWQKRDYIGFFKKLASKEGGHPFKESWWSKDMSEALSKPGTYGYAKLSKGRYVIVEEPPAVAKKVVRIGGVDPTLDAEVEKYKIVKFLERVSRGKAKISVERLKTLWKHKPSHDFLEERYRNAPGKHGKGGGKHEWVPTNLVPEVVQRAADLIDGVKWITLQHEMRTPTEQLIFAPLNSQYGPLPVQTEQGTKRALRGHIGALYIRLTGSDGKEEFKAQIAGQDPWHEELRKRFRDSDRPITAVKKARRWFLLTIWSGEKSEVPGDVLRTYYRSRAGGKAYDVSDLGAEQRSTRNSVLEMFENVKKLVE